MKENEPTKVKFINERKSVYSPISLIIALLLGVTLIVFLNFLVRDVTRSLYGEPPEFTGSYQNISDSSRYVYKGQIYQDSQAARDVFEKSTFLPYETKSLLVRTIINVPLFFLAVILIYTVGKRKSSYRLAATTYFIAMVVNMVVLLGHMTTYIYKINQKLAIYGISFVLIIVFTTSIIYVQDKFRKKTVPVS